MTYEETIEGLKYLISDDCTDTQHDYIEEIELAIEALEKQTPKKPKEVVIQKTKGSSFFSLNFLCPNCDTAVTGQPYAPNNCKHCGQAIDWSDTEDD